MSALRATRLKDGLVPDRPSEALVPERRPPLTAEDELVRIGRHRFQLPGEPLDQELRQAHPRRAAMGRYVRQTAAVRAQRSARRSTPRCRPPGTADAARSARRPGRHPCTATDTASSPAPRGSSRPPPPTGAAMAPATPPGLPDPGPPPPVSPSSSHRTTGGRRTETRRDFRLDTARPPGVAHAQSAGHARRRVQPSFVDHGQLQTCR